MFIWKYSYILGRVFTEQSRACRYTSIQNDLRKKAALKVVRIKEKNASQQFITKQRNEIR